MVTPPMIRRKVDVSVERKLELVRGKSTRKPWAAMEVPKGR